MSDHHMSDAFKYWTNVFEDLKVNIRYEMPEEEAKRKQKAQQKDLPQFLKPGYKILSEPAPSHGNWWNGVFRTIEMETVQIEHPD